MDYDLKNAISSNRLVGLWRLMTGYRWKYFGAVLSLGIAALAKSATVAVLLPGAFYALRETQLPPIAARMEPAKWCRKLWRNPQSCAFGLMTGGSWVKDGKIAETWTSWDNVAALTQLGLMP